MSFLIFYYIQSKKICTVKLGLGPSYKYKLGVKIEGYWMFLSSDDLLANSMLKDYENKLVSSRLSLYLLTYPGTDSTSARYLSWVSGR